VRLETAITRPLVECAAGFRPNVESRNDHPIGAGASSRPCRGMKVNLWREVTAALGPAAESVVTSAAKTCPG
jgi:hypothetical protein